MSSFFPLLRIALTLALASATHVFGASYYCDPSTGSMANPGTAASPWSTLQAVFAAGKTFVAGDTIYLRDGDHGFPVITADNTGDVTITKEAGHDPMLRRIDFNGATRWVLDGIRIYRPDGPLPQAVPLIWPVAPIYADSLVRIANTSSYITVRNCTVYSATDVSSWTANDWNTKAWTGIYMASGSHHLTIEYCNVTNTNFAIHMEGNTRNIDIRGNVVKNFCGDGIRANCNDLKIEDNVVTDAYGSNGNHYDLIQGFGRARVEIRNNVLISTTSTRPLTVNGCQGIGAFDGWMDDWVVENNLVVVAHPHGLTLLGARNSRVVNNTVIKNPLYTGTQQPWITISNHTDGTPSTGNVMRNNLSSVRAASTFPIIGTVQSNNIVSNNYAALFVDYAGFDFRLKATSPAVNAGTTTDAPSIDLNHELRSAPYDVGAYEYQIPNSVPSVTTTVLADTIAGENYSEALTASGGNGALVWSVESGALPDGLILSSDGIISGAATVDGTFTFTVKVADSDAVTGAADEGVQALSIFVTANSVPEITTTSASSGVYGETYSQTLTATGGNGALVWSVTAGDLPAGLTLSSDGVISGSATAAGTSSFTVLVVDSDGVTGSADEGTQVVSITIAPASATVTLSDLVQTYDGSARSVTFATAPADLPVTVSYAGSSTAPTDAGSYAVVAHVTDPNFAGEATGTLVVNPAAASVTLSDLVHTYDGTPKAATVTTDPLGLSVQLTYNGSPTVPTSSGSYAVVAVVTDANYNGSGGGTLVISQAAAIVTLGDLHHTYDGTPKAVTATTTPTGHTVDFTYDGSTTAPTNPGSYAVVGTINNPDYTGSASGTLFIGITALVRHAPVLNGGLDGSVQMLSGENVTLNGSAWVSGDLLAPGTPTLRLNGSPYFGGAIDSTGATTPTGYIVTLNGGAALRHVVRRVNALALPVVSAPPAPAGAVNVTINNSSQSVSNWSTLRNLTLNSGAGQVVVPAGTYGSFTVNGNNDIILGVAGASEPAIYNFQGITLNGNSRILVVGPVIVTLANGINANGSMGTVAHPEWLTLRIAAGGLTLNSNVAVSGTIIAPNGTITINGNSTLTGTVVSDRLVINGNGLLTEPEPAN